jgi:hypothetical protein
MKIREIGLGRCVTYLLRQFLLFAPALLALGLIYSYDGQPSWISNVFQRLNRLGGNEYPLGSAVLLLVVAGFLSTFINLLFYFRDVWSEVKSSTGECGRRWQFGAVCSLIINLVLLTVFGLLMTLTFFDLSMLNENTGWMPDLLKVARWLALTIFLVFLLGDISLYKAQRARARGLTAEAEKAHHDNDMSLTRLSMALIDVPSVVLALLVLYLINLLTGHQAFHAYRSSGWPQHVVLMRIPDENFELALYGVEAGILAATLIGSQLVFAVLVARWQLKVAEIRLKYPPPARLSNEQANRTLMLFWGWVTARVSGTIPKRRRPPLLSPRPSASQDGDASQTPAINATENQG